MCWAAEETFESDARTPGSARAYVSAQVTKLLDLDRDTEPMPDLELVVSELVTNAVRAGAGNVSVGLVVHHDELQLDIADDGPGWPRLVQPEEHDPRGRGLVLVDALANRWHAERLTGGGKRVTVMIALPSEATTGLACDRPRGGGVAEREG